MSKKSSSKEDDVLLQKNQNGSKTIHIYVVLLILSNFVLFLTVSILVEYRCSNRYVNIFDTMTFDQMSSVQVRKV